MEIPLGTGGGPLSGLGTRSVADKPSPTLQALECPHFRLEILGHRVARVLLVIEDHLHGTALADQAPGGLVLDAVRALERLGPQARDADPDQERLVDVLELFAAFLHESVIRQNARRRLKPRI